MPTGRRQLARSGKLGRHQHNRLIAMGPIIKSKETLELERSRGYMRLESGELECMICGYRSLFKKTASEHQLEQHPNGV